MTNEAYVCSLKISLKQSIWSSILNVRKEYLKMFGITKYIETYFRQLNKIIKIALSLKEENIK